MVSFDKALRAATSSTVPAGADALILKSIVHDWNDEGSITILQNCRRALPASGRLLLVERLMPDQPEARKEDRSVALSDLNMLLGSRTGRAF
jgi:hypothetical protein